MQIVGKINVNQLGEYEELKAHIKEIIEKPDYIIKDNRHNNTMIYLKEIKEINKKGRVVIKLALGIEVKLSGKKYKKLDKNE